MDLDGNVAVFDIEENGPTPNDFEWGHCIADMMTECLPSHTEENIYDFPLTDAQIKPMLLPHIFEEDIWNNGYNYYWMDTIIKLDMEKYEVLRKVLAHRPGTNPVEHKPLAKLWKQTGIITEKMKIELLSIDLSNFCSKQCTFCYNHSTREGNTLWKPHEVIDFASDCISHGVKAVSLGGGEPFEYEGVFDVIDALYPKCYLSVTSNGLPLENEQIWEMLTGHKPDKIHITIHKPDNEAEVNRVECQVQRITSIGIKPGLNLLVGADKVAQAKNVYERMSKVLNSEQIILVPQRYTNTPTSKQLASVSGGKPFQSPSCLLKCQRPKNFCSVSWDKKVNSCSFAPNKEPLKSLDYNGLIEALEQVKWRSCQ